MSLILTRTGNVGLDGHALDSQTKDSNKESPNKTRSNEYKQ